MSTAKKPIAVAMMAFITAATFVAENAHPPPRSSGDPGNNPNDGSSGNPAPRSDNSSNSSSVIYAAPSNGKFKLEHTGYGAALPNGHVRNCPLCRIR